jgi:hypothetical protein
VEHYEPGSYRFAHDLVRETLFEGVLAPRRARLHARYGEALEAVLGTRADEAAAELAHHFRKYPRRRRPAPVRRGSVTLGRQQRTAWLGSPTRTPPPTTSGPWSSSTESPSQTSEPAASCCSAWATRAEGAATSPPPAALEPAFRLARELGEAEWMARAALDLGSSSSWGLWEDLWLPDETAIRLLEGALAVLPEDDSVLRARVLGQLAVQFRTEDELHTRSEQALQMARRLNDPLALTDALGARLVAWPVTGPDGRLTYADELVAMAHAARLREPARSAASSG